MRWQLKPWKEVNVQKVTSYGMMGNVSQLRPKKKNQYVRTRLEKDESTKRFAKEEPQVHVMSGRER